MLAWREIAIRYKQSLMGFFWALLMPAMIVLAGLIVRAGVAKMTGTPIETSSLTAIMVKSLPWAFFVSAIRLSTVSLTSNSNLVTRARCPRLVFPLSSILSSLFDLAVAAVPLSIVLAVVGLPMTSHLFWIVPILFVLVVLVSGLGVALATANLFYRDVKYIVEIVLMFAIFFTPVLYESEMLGEWQHWILLNPIAPLLEGLRSAVVLGRMPDLIWLSYSAVVSFGIAGGAWLLFRRLEPSFADRI